MTGRFRDFDAARAERVEEPLTFKLGGYVFTCRGQIPVGPVLTLATSADLTGPDAIRALGQFLRDLVVDDDQAEFGRVLGEVGFDDLFAVVQWVLEEVTGRPLSSASPSPSQAQPGGADGKSTTPQPEETPTP